MTIPENDKIPAKDVLPINKDDFQLRDLGDELRVERLCQKLLRRFYDQLLADGIQPAEASAWVGGADYYLRDFVIDNRRLSIFAERPGTVRQFAGNWYIINTIEPNLVELTPILEGVKGFYRFLFNEGLVSAAFLAEVDRECNDIPWYAGRIESFWAITGDGYLAWEKECSLKSA